MRHIKNGTEKENHGAGAIVSVLIKFVHPLELIRNKFPNPSNQQRLENCQTLHQEVKQINRKEQLSLVVTHEDFKSNCNENLELHAVKKHFKVEQEGDPDLFFDTVADNSNEEAEEPSLPAVIDDEVMGRNHGGANELAAALNGVVDIDDDNEPTPENIPGAVDDRTFSLESEWGHSGICYCHQQNIPNSKVKKMNSVKVSRSDVYLQLFECFFPKSFIKTVMLPAMNQQINDPVTYSEFLQWISLWILMSTVDGTD